MCQVVKQLSDVSAGSELDRETDENLAEVGTSNIRREERKPNPAGTRKRLTAAIQEAMAGQPAGNELTVAQATGVKDHRQAARFHEAEQRLSEYRELLREITAGVSLRNSPEICRLRQFAVNRCPPKSPIGLGDQRS